MVIELPIFKFRKFYNQWFLAQKRNGKLKIMGYGPLESCKQIASLAIKIQLGEFKLRSKKGRCELPI